MPSKPITHITLPKPVMDNWIWQEQGLCRQVDTEAFFHEPHERGESRRTRNKQAIAICKSCPVIVECLEHALSVPEIYGIWGGKSEEEREELVDERKRSVNQ